LTFHYQQGQVAVTGTAAPLSTDRTLRVSGTLIVKAAAANSGSVYLGNAGVTSSTGYPLYPGEELPITTGQAAPGRGRRETLTPNEIHVVGTNGDRLAWMGPRI
jgi:hypothetical protein